MEKAKAFISVGHYPKRPGAINTKYGLIEHHEARKIVDALFTEIITPKAIFIYSPVGSLPLLLRAKKSIHISMYSFTHPDLTRALSIAQNKHKVEVMVILDSQAANDISEVDELIKERMPVKISTGWGKMHHKNCVIDGRIVLVGSAIFSGQ